MTSSTSELRVAALPEAPDDALVAALDEILDAARSALVWPGERFDRVRDRLLEVGADRRLLYAEAAGRVAGVADVVRHYPEPGTLTVAVVAVAPQCRFRGVGRALVEAAIDWCRPDCHRLAAGVHADNASALDFWAALGFDVEAPADAGVVTIGGPIDRAPA